MVTGSRAGALVGDGDPVTVLADVVGAGVPGRGAIIIWGALKPSMLAKPDPELVAIMILGPPPPEPPGAGGFVEGEEELCMSVRDPRVALTPERSNGLGGFLPGSTLRFPSSNRLELGSASLLQKTSAVIPCTTPAAPGVHANSTIVCPPGESERGLVCTRSRCSP